LPLGEFLEHKAFWDLNRWGIQEDILASQLAQLVGIRTSNKPLTDTYAWKRHCFESANVVKRIGLAIKEMNKRIRTGVMSMAAAIQGHKK
jgi:hypothetical protein